MMMTMIMIILMMIKMLDDDDDVPSLGVAEKFLADLRAAVLTVRKSPDKEQKSDQTVP